MEQQVSNIRKGKTILVKWQVSADIPLPKESLTLELTKPNKGSLIIPNKNWTFKDGVVEYTHEGIEQCALGTYGYTLWLNKGQWGQTCVDKTLAYNLVARTEQETPLYIDHLELVTIELTSSVFDVMPTIGGSIPDAPKDGEVYGRQNGEWAKIALGKGVKVVELMDLPISTGKFTCDSAFEFTLNGQQTSHHRMITAGLRVDCFTHAIIDSVFYPNIYIITSKYNGEWQVLGALRNNGTYYLVDLQGNHLDTIMGEGVEWWKETIFYVFGDNLTERFRREDQKWVGVNLDNVIGDSEGANGEFYIYNRGNNSFLYENQQNNHTWKRPTLFKCTIEYNSGVKEIRLRSTLSDNCWYVGDPSLSGGIPLPYFDNSTSRTRRSVLEVADGDIEHPLCSGVSYRFTKTNKNGGNKRWLEAQYIGTNDISTGQSESEYNEWLFISPEQYEDKRGRY